MYTIDFPVFLIGTTDKHRKFHPFTVNICRNETHAEYEYICRALKKTLADLFNHEYRPDILIADGADAITNGFKQAFEYNSKSEFMRVMCWAHMYRLVAPMTSKFTRTRKHQISLTKHSSVTTKHGS